MSKYFLWLIIEMLSSHNPLFHLLSIIGHKDTSSSSSPTSSSSSLLLQFVTIDVENVMKQVFVSMETCTFLIATPKWQEQATTTTTPPAATAPIYMLTIISRKIRVNCTSTAAAVAIVFVVAAVVCGKALISFKQCFLSLRRQKN